jgi:hypothetical protein
MESISGNDIDLAKPAEKGRATKCDGLGAKRRVSCVISALLYRWLEARCFEWHAELTQNELLTDIDFIEPVVIEGGAKSNKKKKAKKKSGGGDKALNKQKDSSIECPLSDAKEGNGTVSVNERNKPEDSFGDNIIETPEDNRDSTACSIHQKVVQSSAKSTSIPVHDSNEESSSLKEAPTNAGKKKKKAKKSTMSGDKETTIRATSPKTEERAEEMPKSAGVQPVPPNRTNNGNLKSTNNGYDVTQIHVETDIEGRSGQLSRSLNATKKHAYPVTKEPMKATKSSDSQSTPTEKVVPSTGKMPEVAAKSSATLHELKESNKTVTGKSQSRTNGSDITKPADVAASDLQPRVGVIDYNGKVISAEDFLVGRMTTILAEIEEIKSRYTFWF